MSEERQSRTCCQCELPLIELDAYGERLCGCVGCNNWQALDSGEWRHLSDDDVAALCGMVTRWTKAAEGIGEKPRRGASPAKVKPRRGTDPGR
jgi:hypothetical protein